MGDLKGKAGELRATIQVTRAATGKVETFELVGGVTLEQARQLGLEESGREHGASGAMVGQGASMNNQPKEG